jgi:SAM-dependent methyltransferase
MKHSDDYHDYVFKNGRMVGNFDEMYRYSKDIPWHQDETTHQVFSDIDIAILRQYTYESICDIGCGLGYFSNRLLKELKAKKGAPKVTGFDISGTAIKKASRLFPEIRFVTGDLLRGHPLPREQFDLVVAKELFWYVCHRLPLVLKRVIALVKDNGFLYVSLCFPESDTWVGQHIIDCPETLKTILCQYTAVVHYCVEYDEHYNGRPLVHYLGRVIRDENK